MKICTKCKLEKDLSEFAFKSKVKGTLQGMCRLCKRLRDNEDYKREGRKISIRKANKRLRLRIKESINDFKKDKQCVKCGDKRHYVLDFHHLIDKEFDIASSISSGKSKKRLFKEIEKCELLCANCHRELHYLEKLECSSKEEHLPDT